MKSISKRRNETVRAAGLIRCAVYISELLMLYVLQELPYPIPEICSGRAVLMISLPLTVASFEREIPAVIFAALCGVFSDRAYSGAAGFYSVMLPLTCLIVSLCFENYLKRNIFTVMLASAVCIPVILFMQFLFSCVLTGYSGAWPFFPAHYIPRILCTFLAVPVCYGMNRLLPRSGRMKRSSRLHKHKRKRV